MGLFRKKNIDSDANSIKSQKKLPSEAKKQKESLKAKAVKVKYRGLHLYHYFRIVVRILFISIILLFFIQNNQHYTDISLFLASYTHIPTSLVILVSFLVGMLFTILWTGVLISSIKRRKS